jgi:hypothetical protein
MTRSDDGAGRESDGAALVAGRAELERWAGVLLPERALAGGASSGTLARWPARATDENLKTATRAQ